MRKLSCLIIILSLLSACTPGSEPAGEIQLTVVPIEATETTSSEPTLTFTPTSTPSPTSLRPQPTETLPPANIRDTTNCSLRTDLPGHEVVTGDTLSNIASRHNTSVTHLSELNCLSDSNLIQVGMTVYVPITLTLPAIPTVSPPVLPTRVSLGVRGTLGVYPVIEAGNPSDWTDYVIEPQTSITVNWTGIEPEYYNDIVSVTFFFTPDVGASAQLGIDDDMSDGMSYTWTAYAGVSGLITATAQTNDNGFWTSSTIRIRDS